MVMTKMPTGMGLNYLFMMLKKVDLIKMQLHYKFVQDFLQEWLGLSKILKKGLLNAVRWILKDAWTLLSHILLQ